MKAIIVTDPAGGTAGMKLADRPEPQPSINDVVVQVHAAGFVNTELDWPSTWTDRLERDRTPSIPGHELAGIVTALGYGTTGLSIGQRVFGLADWSRDGTLFATSGRNLLAAEAAAGVRHHVVLSIVGVDRVPGQGYFEAKVVQEQLVEASGIPFTIVRSTQFLEFLAGLADAHTAGGVVRVPVGLLQPIAADDLAAFLAEVALGDPLNGTVEIAGPQRASFEEILARYLKAVGDARRVVSDPDARYFGGLLEETSLVPLDTARAGRLGLDDWLRGKTPINV